MKGPFLGTSASRLTAPFLCNTEGGLDEGLYLPDTLQSMLSSHIGH